MKPRCLVTCKRRTVLASHQLLDTLQPCGKGFVVLFGRMKEPVGHDRYQPRKCHLKYGRMMWLFLLSLYTIGACLRQALCMHLHPRL